MRLLEFYSLHKKCRLSALAVLVSLLSLPATAIAQDCNGGWISTVSGMEEVMTCPGDGIDDVIEFKIQHQRGKFRYLVTDEDGNILGLPPGNEVNFEGAGEGVCLVWGLGYQGEFIANIGDNIYTTDLCTGCFNLSENAVRIIRDGVEAGKVYAEGEKLAVETCPGDGVDDVITFNYTKAEDASTVLVVTDQEGKILGLPPANEVNFEGAGEGVCLVWSLNFTGEVLVEVGDNALTSQLTDGCYALSDTFVTVTRGMLDAGKIYAEGGLTEVMTCASDGVDDVIKFNYTDPGDKHFQIVVTDTDGKILGLPPANEVNFEGAGAGTCLVWGLVFTGNLTAEAGDNALEISLSDGCYDLSDEFVKVVRTEVLSGMVYAEGEKLAVETCPGDGVDDVIAFNYTEADNASTVLVVTDQEGKILGLPPANEVNFEGAGEGVCLVWSLNFTGEVLVEVGDNALTSQLTDGCYALSDTFVTVTRGQLDAGKIYAEGGLSEVMTCASDGVDDVIKFNYTDPGDKHFQIVVTDTDGKILGLPPANEVNFEGAGAGTCLVWGLVFTGNLTAEAGDNALEISLSDGCYDLSDEFVKVVRTEVLSGMVYAEGEKLAVETCPGDGVDDVIAFNYTEADNASTVLVVTDQEGNILGLPPANEVNFEGAGEGVCLVWSLNFTGEVLVEVGDNALTSQLTDGCYALSDTFVTVTRGMLDAGMIYAEGEVLTVNTCPGDGIDDVIAFNYSDPGDKSFQIVVTDQEGTILGLPPANEVNFEGAGEGVCLVWGLVFTGNFTAEAGQNAFDISFSDGCYALSDTFVTVIRTAVTAGTVSIEGGGLAAQTCPGDGIDDIITFSYSDGGNASTAIVVTDEEGTILGLPPANMVNFEGAGEGTCLVWSLNYTGEILVGVGDNALTSTLTSGCSALSDTFVTVSRGMIDGGMIYAEGEVLEVNTCPGDSIADVITFMHSSMSDVSFNLIVTDPDGIILGIPPTDSVDFEGAGEGLCLVWGLYYTGSITVVPGDNALELPLSDGCFALSDTFVSVIRSQDNCPSNDSPTSVSTISREVFNVYPNPSEGLIRLNFSTALNSSNEAEIAIYDLRGQQVYGKKYRLSSFQSVDQLTMSNASNATSPFLKQDIEIDMRGIEEGIYILQLRHAGKVKTSRVMIR